MTRRRMNNTTYSLSVELNEKRFEFEHLDNYQVVADTLNETFFSGLKVISRSMISNWIHYPHKPRRDFANKFIIRKRISNEIVQ